MALVADKGVDFKKLHQKKMQKIARKEKTKKVGKDEPEWEDVESENEDGDSDGEEGESEAEGNGPMAVGSPSCRLTSL